MAVLILIPAAGGSSRMRGADKLMEPVGGMPLLRRQALRALATGARVLITLPCDRPAREAALAGLAVTVSLLPDAAEGMAASLRHGAGVAAGLGAALLVLPADMPDLDTADLQAVIAAHAAHPDALLRAVAEDGTPGHPVLFPPDLLPALSGLAGDEGARAVVQTHRARLRPVPLPGTRALTDLDTPEAWAAWRAQT